MPTDLSQDIRDRTFRYACAVATLVLKFSPDYRLRSIVDQLIRSATSVGANLEEAKAAELKLASKDRLDDLRGEGDQISRILGAIVVSTKRRLLAKMAVFAFCILNFALLNSAVLLSS